MASWSNRASVTAVCVGLLALAGCSREGGNKYGPPQPAETTGGPVGGSVTGGTGGTATSAGGGGTTTTTTDSTSTSSVPVPNYCECAYQFTFTAPCGDCVIAKANGSCKDTLLQCQLDGMCAGLVNCPGQNCAQKPPADQVACIQDCMLPFPDDTPHQLYADFMDCVCGACAAECQPAMAITCE